MEKEKTTSTYGGLSISSLRALVDAATPGPWERPWRIDFEEDGSAVDVLGLELRGPTYTQLYAGEQIPGIRDCVCSVGIGAHGRHVSNLAFIAAARSAMPDLLDRIVALERDLEGK